MKRYIESSSNFDKITNAKVIKLLKDHGIDTTMQQYELCAQGYERYGSGSNYRIKFKCPGDWLAYISMAIHESITPSTLSDYFYDMDGIVEMVDLYPSVEAIAEHASEAWYGDGDDYIYYLKNLTTGQMLYEGDEGYYEDEYDDEDEWYDEDDE